MGFTLIELLVVITIIVVLLALLVPAMDKAIYQAELMNCGTKIKTVANQVLIYAYDHKRRYPDRGLGDQNPEQEGGVFSIQPTHLTQPDRQYDMREVLEGYVLINKMLQCPLVGEVDLEDVTIDEYAAASYAMWWAWRYHPKGGSPQAGMFKVGDKFAWEGQRYSTLIGDFDRWLGGENYAIQTNHPDKSGLLAEVVVQDESFVGADPALPNTLAMWGGQDRGLMDMNHGYDDGSVERISDVTKNSGQGANQHDRRLGWVPMQFNVLQAWKGYQIPKR